MTPRFAVDKTACSLITQTQLYYLLRHAGRTTSILRILASVALLSAALFAQSTSAGKISFSNTGGSIAISVPSGTVLRTVIVDLCENTKSHCEGTENVPKEQMPDMSIRGSWEHVLEQLLAGSGLNYVAVSAMPNSAGSLVILPSSQPSGTPEDASVLSPRGLPSRLGPPRSDVPPTESAQSYTEDAEVSTEEEASQPSATGYLPFPDSHGRPVPANPQVSGGMPFSTGNTEATESGAAQFLPFPDSRGKPIPAKPGPPGLPFSENPN
jgi:hypothetical protein